MKKSDFYYSRFSRVEDDDYKTVDKRCVYSFLEHFRPMGKCVDVCSPTGSGIVTALSELGYDAHGIGDAFASGVFAEWVIFNPPYKRPLVDQIITRQIKRIKDGDIGGAAVLVRSNFDFAKDRVAMFEKEPLYYAQIKMLYRPLWFEKRSDVTESPKHQFVWHIWKSEGRQGAHPITLYGKHRPKNDKDVNVLRIDYQVKK